MLRKILAWLLVGGAVAVVALYVLGWALACWAVYDDPWLQADVRA